MKKTLVCCVGLPASGKSHWTLLQLASGNGATGATVRINMDTIRRQLGWTSWATWDFTSPKEKEVPSIRDRELAGALQNPLVSTVISDDTNLSRKARTRLEAIARLHGADFVVKRFETPIEECIRRDALRGAASVGEAVIRKFAAKYTVGVIDPDLPYPDLHPYRPNATQPNALICDLDGTLSLFKDKGHRGPYDASKADQDECNLMVKHVLEVYYRFMDWRIVYVSGRSGEFRPQTEAFFRRHHVPPGSLFMRAPDDKRKDWVVKYELFDRYIRNDYWARLVLDDRDQVVKMWRQIGIPCWQVADGRF